MKTHMSTADVLCIYGALDQEKYQWLEEKPTHFLIVLSENTISLPEHPRIRLASPDDEEALKKIALEFVFLEFEYVQRPGCEKAFAKMAHIQEKMHLIASDFQERGLDRLENFLKNAPFLKRAKSALDLFEKFKDIPAIICGAGPSLEREALLLKDLRDKALIFGGGTALSALQKLGVSPHFAGIIDPHPPASRFFQEGGLKIPTLFQTRAHSKLLSQCEGPLLWTPGSENDFFDEKTFDGGWNVSTFLTALAMHFGCNPIILVGVDLAQTKEKPYAMDLDRPEEGELIQVGDGLYTRRDWLFAADWLSEFASLHEEKKWINASSGIELKGFTPKKLKSLALDPQDNLEKRVEETLLSLQNGAQILSPEEFKASLELTSKLCIRILKLLENIFPTPPEKHGEFTLLEVEIEKELAYQRFYQPIWDVWKHVFEREIPPNFPKAYGIELNKWLFMKGICDEARKI